MELKTINLPAELPDDFYELPHSIYSRGHLWIPPFISSEKARINGLDALTNKESIAVLCYKNNRIVGRMIVFIDDKNSYKNTGFFGLLEVIDNVDVLSAMFELAENWLKERGKTKISGPINLNFFYGTRLISEGHELPPFYKEPRNPIFYNELLTAIGMKAGAHTHTWILNQEAIKSLYTDLKQSTPKNSEIEISQKQIAEMHGDLFQIYKEIQKQKVKTILYTQNTFDNFIDSIKRPLKNKQSMQFIATLRSKMAAFCLTHFNLASPLISMNGDAKYSFQLQDFKPDELVIDFLRIVDPSNNHIIEQTLLKNVMEYCLDLNIKKIFIYGSLECGPLMTKYAKKERRYSLYSKTIK